MDIDLTNLTDIEVTDTKWIIPNILPTVGLYILAGRPKSGKSRVLQHLLCASHLIPSEVQIIRRFVSGWVPTPIKGCKLIVGEDYFPFSYQVLRFAYTEVYELSKVAHEHNICILVTYGYGTNDKYLAAQYSPTPAYIDGKIDILTGDANHAVLNVNLQHESPYQVQFDFI